MHKLLLANKDIMYNKFIEKTVIEFFLYYIVF